MAAADPSAYMPTELIAETLAPRPGSTILLGFKMNPKPGWHGYWSNPGDAGIVPTVRWTAPSGVTFGPLLHPAPTLISDSGIHSFVHKGQHVLLTRMKVPASIEPGTPLPVRAKLDWAACTATQCVPLSATFSLELVAGGGARSAESAALQSALRQLPKAAPEAIYSVSGDTLRLHVPAALKLSAKSARFFPDDNDAFATGAARAYADNHTVLVEARTKRAPSGSLTGVVSDGRSAYRIRFVQGEAPMAAPQKEEPALEQEEAEPQPSAEPAKAEARSAAEPVEDEPSSHWLWLALAGAIALAAGAVAVARRG